MKVFVTVGSMLPFDRLVIAADAWAAAHPHAQVMAQIGEGRYHPKAMRGESMMAPATYRQHCAQADVIVSHLGMGTVITAAELGRPLVALPRRRELSEVTSDHQAASAQWLRDKPGLIVIDDVTELGTAIDRAVQGAGLQDVGLAGRDKLVQCVRSFLLAALRD